MGSVSTDEMQTPPISTVNTGGKPLSFTTRDLVYVTAEALVGLLTVVVNCMALAALWRYRILRTVTNYYTGSLAMADILVGLFVPPLVAVAYTGLPHDFYFCILVNVLVNCFTAISILSLVCVAFDRYVAIRHPVIRLNMVTRRLASKIIAAVWSLGTLLGLVPLLGWHNDREGFTACSYVRVIPVQYNVYLQFFGYILPVLLAVVFLHISICCGFHSSNERRKEPRTSKDSFWKFWKRISAQEMKLFTNVALNFTMFALCWVPLYILNCIRLWSPETPLNLSLVLFTVVLTHFNSFINPILYTLNQPGFRQVFGLYLPAWLCSDLPTLTTTTAESGRKEIETLFTTDHAEISLVAGHEAGLLLETRTTTTMALSSSAEWHTPSSRQLAESTDVDGDLPVVLKDTFAASQAVGLSKEMDITVSPSTMALTDGEATVSVSRGQSTSADQMLSTTVTQRPFPSGGVSTVENEIVSSEV